MASVEVGASRREAADRFEVSAAAKPLGASTSGLWT
jgi:hypothetical protein